MAAKTNKLVPFDYQTALQTSGWREKLRWPFPFEASFQLCDAGIRSYLSFVATLKGDACFLALQAGVLAVAYARYIADLALALQSAEEIDIEFAGGPLESLCLSGGMGRNLSSSAWMLSRETLHRISVPNFAFFRRYLRSASWTSGSLLPRALFSPSIVAISHNGLLRYAAAKSKSSVGYRHAETILSTARQQNAESLRVPDDLCDGLTQALTNLPILNDEYKKRVAALVKPFVAMELQAAALDYGGLRALRRLPKAVWSGTGGQLASRALGLEIARRGGTVTRFDHGYSTPLVGVVEPTVQGELAVSTHFAVATQAGAAEVRALQSKQPMPFPKPEIIVTEGDRSLEQLSLISTRQARKRRVVYAPTILSGILRHHPPLLPDLIYLDWQLRLASLVKKMPVNLICQPHPEGLLKGQRHPLHDVAVTHTGRFEELIEDTDVFLFDYGQSTTFGEALCTDRIIVFADFGNPLFTPTARALIEQRCRVLPIRFDDRNRPEINEEALREALCSGADRADPSEIQSMLI